MPNYRRVFIPGGTFFFTLTLRSRRSDLLVRHIDHLRASWRDLVRDHPFNLVAAVVLPDHLHIVMALPEGDCDYSKRLSRLKQGFTKRLPEAHKTVGRKGERNVWQSRFWEHAIRDERDLAAHVDYIHFNPVKHALVMDMDEWPYSTWHKYKRTLGRTWNPAEIDLTVGEP